MSATWEAPEAKQSKTNQKSIITRQEWKTLYELLDKVEFYFPNWLSISTAKALVKSTIRLNEDKRK